MKSILFVNGCIRGEESRTLLMARRFLDCLRGKYEITEGERPLSAAGP